MSFRDDFPALSNFLGSWFPDADFDDLDDLETVSHFVQASPRKEVQSCLDEGERLLSQTTFPYSDLGMEANRYFDHETAGREWLASILVRIREKMAKVPME